MDPASIPATVPVDLAALLGSITLPKDAQIRAVLLQLMNQELDVLFEARVPEGVRLRLPEGQALIAQGDLPYPEGTTLKVQVLPPPPGETAPRLQTLSAQIPPLPAVLAPLIQGEALPMLQRLQAEVPLVPYRALAALFQILDTPPAPPTPAAQAPQPPAPNPAEVPLPLQAPLAKVLLDLLPKETPERLVNRWVKGEPTAAPPSALLQDPGLPPEIRDTLTRLLNSAQAAASGPKDAPAPLALPPALPPELRQGIQGFLAPRLPPPPLDTLIQRWTELGPLPPKPQWVRAALQDLHRPTASSPDLASRPSPNPITTWLESTPLGLKQALVPVLREVFTKWVVPQEAVLAELSTEWVAPKEAVLAELSTEWVAPKEVPLRFLGAVAGLPREQQKALAVALGLPPSAPPKDLAQALWALATAPAKPELPSLPLPLPLAEALARALPPSVPPQESTARTSLPLPQVEIAEKEISRWPEALRMDLAQALGQVISSHGTRTPQAAPTTPKDLAEALVRWIQELESEPESGPKPGKGTDLPLPLKGPLPRGSEADLPAEWERILKHPALPASLKESARNWFKAAFAPAETPKAPSAQPKPQEAALPALNLKGLALDPPLQAGLEARLAGAGPGVLTHAEPWEAWVKASLQTLSNPQASPREAPFHALQALEDTAYFEIPLPGRASSPLQLWVEKEPTASDPGAPPIHKVLLGLHFTAIGETRVGMLLARHDLSVKIWAEHPDPLRAREAELRASLEALGDQVSLQVSRLPSGSPDPRSLLGPGYQGLA